MRFYVIVCFIWVVWNITTQNFIPFYFTLSRDFRPLTVISDDLRVISDVIVKLSQNKKHCARNRINHGRPREFVFHRNHSPSLAISGIQTHSDEPRSARAPMMDSPCLHHYYHLLGFMEWTCLVVYIPKIYTRVRCILCCFNCMSNTQWIDVIHWHIFTHFLVKI